VPSSAGRRRFAGVTGSLRAARCSRGVVREGLLQGTSSLLSRIADMCTLCAAHAALKLRTLMWRSMRPWDGRA
jgi:hypothetical protein